MPGTMADSLDVARSYAVARRRHKMEQTDSAKIREQQFYLYVHLHLSHRFLQFV